MGYSTIKLNLDGFKMQLRKGFLAPSLSAFDYIDRTRFAAEEDRLSDPAKTLTLSGTFDELKKRMAPRYFNKVLLAQLEAYNYASLRFPAYKFIAPEDLADDWLATVDFHKKYARDHSLHQPLTAYCAASLLGFGESSKSLKIPASPGNLLEYCVNSIVERPECAYLQRYAGLMGIGKDLTNNLLKKEYWKQFFYNAVILSALFHDIGYPWQYIRRLGKTIGDMRASEHGGQDNVDDCISIYADKLFMFPFCRYCYPPVNPPLKEGVYKRDLIKDAQGTHGLSGAQAFLTLNDMFRVYPSPSGRARQQEFSVEWAALGIMMHDLVKLNKPEREFRIDFNVDPLSSVVTMADYLEEFERPRPEFKKSGIISYKSACRETRLSVEEDVLVVTMKYNDSRDIATAKSFKLEETNEYFETGRGYIDMTTIGFREVKFKPELKS